MTHVPDNVAAVAENAEDALYEDWKRRGKHWKEYGSELLGTAVLLFCVVGAVAFLFGQSAALAQAVTSTPLRLLLVGLALGGVSGLVAISPPGRLSGAHLNPAVSLGFWALGKMHARDLGGYVAAQLLGGVGGAFLGRLAFGKLAREVKIGSLHPGPGVGWMGTLGGEIVSTLILTVAVFSFVSHKKLARWTPLMAVGLVGLLVCVDGNYSGAGMNPARWFGPAVAAPVWAFGWEYALGPLIAALGAVGMVQIVFKSRPTPHTGKLFHDPKYRSIFRGDRLPSRSYSDH